MEEVTVKLSTGNRLTIPKTICEQLNLLQGDTLYLSIDNNNIILSKNKTAIVNATKVSVSRQLTSNLIDNYNQQNEELATVPELVKNDKTLSKFKPNLEDLGKYEHQKLSDCGLVVKTKTKYIKAFCDSCKGQLLDNYPEYGDKPCSYKDIPSELYVGEKTGNDVSTIMESKTIHTTSNVNNEAQLDVVKEDTLVNNSNVVDNTEIVSKDINVKNEVQKLLEQNKTITADIYQNLSKINKKEKYRESNSNYYRCKETFLKPVKLSNYIHCQNCGFLYNNGFLIDEDFYCKDCTIQDFKNYISKIK